LYFTLKNSCILFQAKSLYSIFQDSI